MHKALITGASRGIGKVIKEVFENNKIEVIAPVREQLDLASNESIDEYFRNLKEDEDIDILINNAGINELGTLEDITDDEIDRMIQVNLIAQLKLIKALSPKMKEKGYGRIVNLGSIWSGYTKIGRMMYTIAKTGVSGLTRASAVELAKHNILVNAVAPGFVDTEMTRQNNTLEQIKCIENSIPINRLAKPEEIAEVIYFLASEKNSFMTGQTIFVDGGFSCV